MGSTDDSPLVLSMLQRQSYRDPVQTCDKLREGRLPAITFAESRLQERNDNPDRSRSIGTTWLSLPFQWAGTLKPLDKLLGAVLGKYLTGIGAEANSLPTSLSSTFTRVGTG